MYPPHHSQQARQNYSGTFPVVGQQQTGVGQSYGPDGQFGQIPNMYDGFQNSIDPNATAMKHYGNHIGNESNYLESTDTSGGITNTNNHGMFNAGTTSGYTMQQQNFSSSYPGTAAGYGMVGQDNMSTRTRSFPMNSSGIETFDQTKSASGYSSIGIRGKNAGYSMVRAPIGSRRVSAPAGIGQRNIHQRSSTFPHDMPFSGSDVVNSGFPDQQTINSMTNRNYTAGQYHAMQINQSNMFVPGELPMVSEGTGNLQQNYPQQTKYPTSYHNTTNVGMRGQKIGNYGMSRSSMYPNGSSSQTCTTSRPSIQRSFSTGTVDDSYNKMPTGGHMVSASYELNQEFMNGIEFRSVQMKRGSSGNMNLLDSMGQQVGNRVPLDQPQMNHLSTQRLRHYGPVPVGSSQSNSASAIGFSNMNSNTSGMDSTGAFPNASVGYTSMQSASGLNSNTSNFESAMPNPMQTMNPPGTMGLDRMALVNHGQPGGQGYISAPPIYPSGENYNIPRSQRYTTNKLQSDTYGPNLPTGTLNGNDILNTFDHNINTMAMGEMNSSNAMQFQTQAARRHARTDRIFSQELEKLAKLSRNPMSEPFAAPEISPPIESEINPPVNSFSVASETIPSPNTFQKTALSPGFQPEQLPQPSKLPEGDSFMQSSQSNRKTNLKSMQNMPNTPHYSAPSTPSNQSVTIGMDIPVSSSSPNNTPTSHVFTTDSVNSPPIEFKDTADSDDSQNAVQHLQMLTHSLKDKHTDPKGQKSEYLTHGTEGNTEGGSQNCIAALSAACRNMIADMDNTMPKQKNPNQAQGNSSLPSFETLTGSSTPNYPSNTIGRPPNNGISNSTNNNMPTNSFNNNQYGMSTDYLPPPFFAGTNNSMGVDFQLQYQDFLEQSLPMQMTHKRPDEKPKRTRRRKVSDDMSDQISNTSGQKRRRSRKKSQNPPSVDSAGTPQSIETCATSALSDHFLDDITNNGGCNTPLQTLSFGSMNSHTPSPICANTKESPCHDTLSGNFLDSDKDIFDSVFSPDTTGKTLPHDQDDSTNNMLQINPSPNTSKPATPNRPSSNYSNASLPIVSPKSGQILSTPPNGLPTSTCIEFTSNHVLSEKVTQLQEPTNEAHPLEILQQQIQLQRQQFNLGDTGSITGKEPTIVKPQMTSKVVSNNSSLSQTDIDVDALIMDKNSSWYLPTDTKQEQVLLQWDDSKKNSAAMPSKVDQVDRRTQHKLSEQKRRETIKNSLENLKNAVPDCRNLDQNQQSVLLKGITIISLAFCLVVVFSCPHTHTHTHHVVFQSKLNTLLGTIFFFYHVYIHARHRMVLVDLEVVDLCVYGGRSYLNHSSNRQTTDIYSRMEK